MKTVIVIVLLAAISGCASNPDAPSLLDRLEFGEGETGCFRVTGLLDVGGNPFASTSVNVSLVKRKGDDAPDC
jgi:hypothetical protein